ncbi:MAG: DUF4491 family protein [Christensenellales bacterium]|jgi:hypothetical protein
MNYTGIVIAACSFLAIGVFHPIVIKCEYYFSTKIWPVFLVFGLALLACSLFVANTVLSSLLGVIGCSSLWSIGELKEQAKRVEKGWFPKNPNRKSD